MRNFTSVSKYDEQSKEILGETTIKTYARSGPYHITKITFGLDV